MQDFLQLLRAPVVENEDSVRVIHRIHVLRAAHGVSVICTFTCADAVRAVAELGGGQVRRRRSEVGVGFAGLTWQGFGCCGILPVDVPAPGLEVGLDVGMRVCGC